MTPLPMGCNLATLKVKAALAAGEPSEAFPLALQKAGGAVIEPLAADFRPDGDGRSALLKLVAGVAGIGLDELIQRDAQKRIRTVTAVTVGALIVALLIVHKWLPAGSRGRALRPRRPCPLLRLRREDPAFAAQDAAALLTAVLGAEAMLVRYRCAAGDRLLLVNLGTDLHLDVAPEPLLAPPLGARWRTLWSSEEPRYGGRGTSAVETDDGFRLPGQATVVLVPEAQA